MYQCTTLTAFFMTLKDNFSLSFPIYDKVRVFSTTYCNKWGKRERERERWGGREKKWEPYMCDGEVSVLYGEREREGGEGERKSGVYACRNV